MIPVEPLLMFFGIGLFSSYVLGRTMTGWRLTRHLLDVERRNPQAAALLAEAVEGWEP